jgi:hypothetical protein
MEMTTKRWVLLGVAVFAVMVMCAGGIGALVWTGMNFMTDSDAYQLAEAQVKASPEVTGRVGAVSEVALDWKGGAQMNQSSSGGVTTGNALYSLVAKGPRGQVPVCAMLSTHDGKWAMDRFVVGKRCPDVGPADASDPGI